jgi:hypothetical protein
MAWPAVLAVPFPLHLKVAKQSAALVLFLIPLCLVACGMLEVGK